MTLSGGLLKFCQASVSRLSPDHLQWILLLSCFFPVIDVTHSCSSCKCVVQGTLSCSCFAIHWYGLTLILGVCPHCWNVYWFIWTGTCLALSIICQLCLHLCSVAINFWGMELHPVSRCWGWCLLGNLCFGTGILTGRAGERCETSLGWCPAMFMSSCAGCAWLAICTSVWMSSSSTQCCSSPGHTLQVAVCRILHGMVNPWASHDIVCSLPT